MDNLVTVAEVDGSRAAIMASILESHGLTVFIENENSSVMLPHLVIPAKIRVPRDQVAKAQEVLQAMPPKSDDPESIELED
jgi:hypothetical protein